MATITATFTKPDGTASAGWVEFEPTHPIVDAGGNVRVPKSPMRVTLDANGALSTTLQPTSGSGIGPAGVQYLVRARIDGKDQPTWRLAFDSDTTVLDLADVSAGSVETVESPGLGYHRFTQLEADVARLAGAGWRLSALYGFGHSYGYLTASDRGDRYLSRMADQLGVPAHNHAQSSSELLDFGIPQGGWTKMGHHYLAGLSTNYGAQQRPIPNGMPVVVTGINDLNSHGADAQWDVFIWAWELAVRSMMAAARLAAYFPHSESGTGQTNPVGSWANATTISQSFAPGYRYSSAAAAEWAIATHANDAGRTHTLFVLAERVGASLAADELIVTLDGAEVYPIGHTERIDTREIVPSTTTAGATLPLAIRIEIPDDAASHDIAVSAANNLGFCYCGYGIEVPRPQLWGNVARIPTAGYSVDGTGDDKVALMNTVLSRVATEFDGYTMVADLDAALDKTTVYFGDNIHPNDTGHAIMADTMLERIAALSVPASVRRFL